MLTRRFLLFLSFFFLGFVSRSIPERLNRLQINYYKQNLFNNFTISHTTIFRLNQYPLTSFPFFFQVYIKIETLLKKVGRRRSTFPKVHQRQAGGKKYYWVVWRKIFKIELHFFAILSF